MLRYRIQSNNKELEQKTVRHLRHLGDKRVSRSSHVTHVSTKCFLS